MAGMTSLAAAAALIDDRAYYAAPGIVTTPGRHAAAVDAMPRDIASLAAIVQGLLVHRFWMPAYGLPEPTKERDLEQGLHGAEAMISRALALDDRPLAEARPPEQRVIGICRHFAVLMTALLRRHGVPARARCGFATYFQPGKHVDHWVCEYWRDDQARWVMVDAQLDPLQIAAIKPDFDPLDVPRDRFIVAGQGWRDVREGRTNPATYGIAGMWGAWFVAGDLLLDAAALAKVELLPWEPWIKGEAETPNPALDALCDELAALAHDPAASMAPLRARLDRGDSRVPQALIDAAVRADVQGPASGNTITAE